MDGMNVVLIRKDMIAPSADGAQAGRAGLDRYRLSSTGTDVNANSERQVLAREVVMAAERRGSGKSPQMGKEQ